MGTISARLATAVLLAAFVVPVAMAQTPPRTERVQFAAGTSSGMKTGTIRGDESVDYLLNVRAGQTMSVSLETNNPSSYFNVIPPGADSAIFIGSTSGNSFSGPAQVSGDHRVQVYLMRNAARRNEAATYTITFGARGSAGVATSRDALVPGTSFHATAKVACGAGDGKPAGRCDAGVIRQGAGTATVKIMRPTGGERVIKFESGRAVSSDGTGAFSVQRKDDLSLVTVGRESYEIPDALIFGG